MHVSAQATSFSPTARSLPTDLATHTGTPGRHGTRQPTLVNVTIPVFNEEARLSGSIPRLHEFLSAHCRFKFEIVIADNASMDRTLEIARLFSETYPEVRAVHLDQKGRGRALKKVWSESQAHVLSYMDVDLSTDLFSLPPLVEALIGGGFDLAIGSRLLKPSLITRGLRRAFISRGYNLLIKLLFHTRFSDAQCGFKAITREAASGLLPQVEDNGWFMDSELLILAEKLSFRIFDLPVRWVDDSDSRVKIWRTAVEDLKGLARVKRNFANGKYNAAMRNGLIHESETKAAREAPRPTTGPFETIRSSDNSGCSTKQ